MTKLHLHGDDLELDGLRIAILEPHVRLGCSLRGRLEEALTMAGQRNDAGELEDLTESVQNAITKLRAKDYEAALHGLIQAVGRDARDRSA